MLLSNLLEGAAQNCDDTGVFQGVVGKFAIIPMLENFEIPQFSEMM